MLRSFNVVSGTGLYHSAFSLLTADSPSQAAGQQFQTEELGQKPWKLHSECVGNSTVIN